MLPHDNVVDQQTSNFGSGTAAANQFVTSTSGDPTSVSTS